MTLAEALDIVAPPGRDRYRQLCDPAHPDYDPRYIPLAIAKAEGRLPPPAKGPLTFEQLEKIRIADEERPPGQQEKGGCCGG